MEHFDNELSMIFYLIDAATSGRSMIHVLHKDTHVFFVLVSWVCWEEMECKAHMERWDMTTMGLTLCCSMACTASAIAT